jgi:hypothetical protein
MKAISVDMYKRIPKYNSLILMSACSSSFRAM